MKGDNKRVKQSGVIGITLILLVVSLSLGSSDIHTASSLGDSRYIVVGLKPDLGLTLDAGLLMAREDADDQLVNDLDQIQQMAQSVQPVFSRPESEIISERKTITANSSTECPDLTRWIILQPSADLTLQEALNRIRALPSVDTAYIKPIAYPASAGGASNVSTPHFVDIQGYLKPAPVGNEVFYAWTVEGGTGKGIVIADVEGDWQNRHKDLRLAKKKVNGVRAGKNTYWYDHGTAVLGILGGRKNGFGVTGIAYKAKILMFSIFRKNENGKMYDNVADAIDRAASKLSKGDILLVEVQYSGLKFDSSYIPVEYYDDVFEAIKAATAKGIVVVEAAANGSQNLDDAMYEDRFNMSVRGDSGAIFVGAGGVPDILPNGEYLLTRNRRKIWFSNYGERVDVQNWGEKVVSIGYGDLYSGKGSRNTYTSSFNGTSSASAVTAGVCASLQGAAKNILGRYLTSEEMRDILRSTGWPQEGNEGTGNIGPRPDLKKAIAAVQQLQK